MSPAREKMKSGVLRFAVDCRLLFELGEQLVARKSVALAELVKNAYDADAIKVVVTLDNITRAGGKIVVNDNGVGMTLDTIKKTWMRVATGAKDRLPYSERFGRRRTGAKGIGRFASRRLASQLVLDSVSKRKDGLKEHTSVVFDWEEFTSGKNIDDVPIRYESRIVRKDVPSGVTLTLNGLREAWQEGDIKELQGDLFSLVSPISERVDRGRRKDPGFSLRLETPEFPELTGELGEKFLEASWGFLKGKLDSRGRAHYTLRIRGRRKLSFTPDRVFKDIGAIQFRIHFFVYRSEFFKNFPFSVGDARQLASQQSGVRIYMDRFRVFPYGDPGDDWLDLDADRGKRLTALQPELEAQAAALARPMLQLPGNNQLFGAVSVSRVSNPNVSLNISRERLIENAAFLNLKTFVRLGVNWMTVQYARYGKTKRSDTAETTVVDPYEQLNLVREEIEKNEELQRDSKAQIIQALDLAQTSWRDREGEQISELSMLRVLATVGTTVVIFDHELRAIIDAFKGIHTDLKEFSSKLSGGERAKYESTLAELSKWTKSVEQQGSQIGILMSREARQQKRRFAVRQVVEDMVSPFARYMEERGIEMENNVPADLRTPPMFGCELQSILLNLHTNALKALKAQSVRKIGIQARRDNGFLSILFSDTGIGVEPHMRNEVFKPFVSTSEPDPVLGVGTGLGLKIVRDLVDVYGGSAHFVDCAAPWKTCVEVRLPFSS
jgi:signal transduction histidine kinase